MTVAIGVSCLHLLSGIASPALHERGADFPCRSTVLLVARSQRAANNKLRQARRQGRHPALSCKRHCNGAKNALLSWNDCWLSGTVKSLSCKWRNERVRTGSRML